MCFYLFLQIGELEGDDYLAELDYIEVVERMKEDYESDVEEEEEEEEEEDSTNSKFICFSHLERERKIPVGTYPLILSCLCFNFLFREF